MKKIWDVSGTVIHLGTYYLSLKKNEILKFKKLSLTANF